MTLESDQKIFKCIDCNKYYASIRSLWNHNNKYYKKLDKLNVSNISTNVSNISTNVSNQKIFNCKYCNKIFNHCSSKSRHEQTCNKNNLINKELIELKKENNEIKNTIEELKKIIEKNCKIHPKTLQKINKQLINNNINNITNNNTTNNITNNINNTYVNFNNHIFYKNILSEKEILNILSKCVLSIEEGIKTVHFNKNYPEYSNIYVTNIKDDNAYVFDGVKFSVISKNDAIYDLIVNHGCKAPCKAASCL